MEDHNQSRNQSESAKEEKLFELSADLELKDQSKHKIIELTEELDTNADQTEAPPIEASPTDDISQSRDNKISDTDETSPLDRIDEENIDHTESTLGEEAVDTEAETSGVEDEVDAAFDAFEDEISGVHPEDADDHLFDDLTDLTQAVDDAAQPSDTNRPGNETPQQPSVAPPALDNEDLAADAAALDAAMAHDDEDPESMDTSDPSVIKAEDSLETLDDDIIELVDIVNPQELEAVSVEDESDDDIIELTDIVDPSELESLDAGSAYKEKATETAGPSDAVDLRQPPEDSHHDEHDEEELSLSGLDDDFDLPTDTGPTPALEEDDFETAEDDTLFADEDIIPEDEPSDSAELAVEDSDIDDILAETDENNEGQFESILEDSANDAPVEDSVTDTISTLVDDNNASDEQILQLSDVISSSKEQQTSVEEINTDSDKYTTAFTPDKQDHADDTDLHEAQDISNAKELSEDEKIEAAVEHIIKTRYADKIEQLITSSVEKAVTREIENIKRSIIDDGESLG